MHPKGQVIGYRRVSTADQNLSRQDFAGWEVDKVFEDQASGASTDRPALHQMLDYVREGDLVVVHSLDRLARSLKDLHHLMDQLKGKGVSAHFIKENLRFDASKETDPFAELMFSILGAFAEFERALIRERQREGIEKAKKAGKYRGGKRKLTDEQVQLALEKIRQGVPKARVAKELGVSRYTIYREIERQAEESK